MKPELERDDEDEELDDESAVFERIAELEGRIADRKQLVAGLDRALAERESTVTGSPMEIHRRRVRELEAKLAAARSERDEARRTLAPSHPFVGNVVATLVTLLALALAIASLLVHR